MTRTSLPETCHHIIREHLQAGDIALDATCGNGHDTLFLQQLIGNTGILYAFDIQLLALEITQKRLQQVNASPQTTLIQASHSDMVKHIPTALHGKVAAIMFNLGYLPGADKSVKTCTKTTLPALNAAIELLAINGILTVMAYPGHPGGDEESLQIDKWLEQIDQNRVNVTTYYSHVPKPHAPRLHLVKKIAAV